MLPSDVPEVPRVLETASTKPPRVLPGSDTVSVTRRGETMFTKRVAATDVRIGLNLLGENGRMLLREYAKTSTAYCTKEREQ